MKLILENWNKFLNETAGAKPRLIFLVGPPAVGKSEWIKKNMTGDYVVLSRDDIVEKVAKESGVGTYDDMYKQPPAEILPTPLPEPKDQQAVKQYLASLQAIADKFNNENPEETKQFGLVKPFTVENYIKALTPRTEVAFVDDKGKQQMGWGVKMLTPRGEQNFIPLYYPKIQTANEAIRKQFEEARAASARDTKDIIIDMVNMSPDERAGHRLEIAKAISEGPVEGIEKAQQIVDDKFDQQAYVFANNLEGWSAQEKEKIKQSAEIRAGEIAQEPQDKLKPMGPKRSKTIPASAYDRFFGQYAAPSQAEGYSTIKAVGIPALTPERGF